MTRSRTAVAALIATAAIAGAGAAASAVGGDDTSRREQVRDRGARVMPFSLDATTHYFDATPTGGIQRVLAKDPGDAEQVRLIREHLREEAAAFARGDFGDPASIHGDDMPGLRELSAGHDRIDVRYRDLPAGARIDYRTRDRRLARAVQAWFDAQLSDHGPDAQHGAGGDHSGHSD
ncbi:MAG TPA: hypothetical protein VM266_04225 [Solirubrobacteraceae bacterium]|nr:hypothetical protein [Solirubrobacteraceae bacterium]